MEWDIKKMNADYWFSVRDLCRFQTKGKEHYKCKTLIADLHYKRVLY